MSIRQKLAFFKPFLPFWLLLLVLTFIAKDHVFFWDTIQLGSKHGHWYFENSFQHFLLPPEIDSGHIPAFGMYIALCWFLFGKSLAVSHLAMLPFLFGIVYYFYKIGKLLTEEKKTTFLLLLLIVDPVFMGQAVLVSPDIALLCFFLMALLGILSEKKGLQWIGITALPLISMRGMMMAFGLFLWEGVRSEGRRERGEEWGARSASPAASLRPPKEGRGTGNNNDEAIQQSNNESRDEEDEGRTADFRTAEGGAGIARGSKFWNPILNFLNAGLKKVPFYIPGGLISIAFLGYHYQQTGWIGYHPDSPWALSYERVGLNGVIKNIGILAWRFLDYGRIFLWIGIGLCTFFLLKGKQIKQPKLVDIAMLFLILLVVLAVPMLTHRAILAHRYLLPVFIVLSLLFFLIWSSSLNNRKGWWRIIFPLVLLGLLTGNRWVYPKKIAQGWDSTLAHWPHYQLRAEMINFIKKEGIPFQEIGTAFPEIGPFKFKDLSSDMNGFAPKDLEHQSYILYANTMNDFTDEEINALEKEWIILHEFQRGGVCFVLYQGRGVRSEERGVRSVPQ